MTIRCGMSGNTVKRIEEFLSGLGFYRGPVDSEFGGGLESAVKRFQVEHRLAATGIVDATTWQLLFPGEPLPASPLAHASLAERCLALTGSFETGKYHPDCFCAITGDFDGMGISFGVLQWNIGQGSLQPILKEMFEQHADVARSIFHDRFPLVQALGSDDLEKQLAFSRSIQARGQVREPWFGMLVTLGRAPECQSIQTAQASKLFEQAFDLCGDFSLFSERAAALMFDILTQQGSIGGDIRKQVMADYAKLPPNEPMNEVARMHIVANRMADAAQSRFQADVRNRKTTIANGAGTVHGVVYDLAEMFNITLRPFGTGAAAASAS